MGIYKGWSGYALKILTKNPTENLKHCTFICPAKLEDERNEAAGLHQRCLMIVSLQRTGLMRKLRTGFWAVP